MGRNLYRRAADAKRGRPGHLALAVPERRLDDLYFSAGTHKPRPYLEWCATDRSEELDRDSRNQHLLLRGKSLDLTGEEHRRRAAVQRLVGPRAKRGFGRQ